MLIFGIAVLVAAVVGFFFMRKARGELHAMIGAETLPVSELEQRRSTADELGGRGGFRERCEVVGAAHPRPEGLLVSELSSSECVWYRYRVRRHYERQRSGPDNRTRRERKIQTLVEHTSGEGYAVQDDGGQLIGVDPNGTRPDHPERFVKRFEPHQKQGPTLFGVQLPRMFDLSGTIGYEYEEWIIRPGQRLYVLGEVHDRIGPLVIAKPEQGYFIISTRSEQELRRTRRKRHTLLSTGVLIAAPLGLLLTALGAFQG